MLDTTTKKRIDDCRDTLVGKLPDPKAQIEQITIALIYKFMDDMDKEAIELGGKAKFFSGDYEKFSWDNLFDAKVTAAQMLQLYSEAIISMDKNPNIPQLFRDIFKNAFLPYRDPETLKLFLKTIGAFEYTHSEKLGDAFEYLLSVMGSQGDAGQFRTPRHIIDFLVKVVNPSKTDTILDPACGTAGFLISAFKHLSENHHEITPDERKRLIQNFTGYDISPDMVRLSLVNLYLHGFSTPHIYEYDTLTSEERWNDTYDVILANPPFMSPKGGIRPHKKFSVSSNRSEVLFVDYIAEHLNNKGRAGVIVPEGVIFQSGTAYKALRKMLVENYLYAVVSLPAGVFNPYSGVKTSILLMDKELAKKTNEILFVKIENDGFNLGAQRTPINGGQLEDAIQIIHSFVNNTSTCTPIASPSPHVNHSDAINRVSTAGASFSQPQYGDIAHAVPKSEIAKNKEYILNGERYKSKLSNDSCFNFVDLDSISELITDGTHKTPSYTDNGIPFLRVTDITQSNTSKKYITIEEHKELIKRCNPHKGDILYSKNGTIGVAKLIDWEYDFSIFVSLALIKPLQSLIIPKYLEILLNSEQALSMAKGSSKSGTVTNLHLVDIKKLQIPLPPLSVQQEIVAEIEGYQNEIGNYKKMIEEKEQKIKDRIAKIWGVREEKENKIPEEKL